MIKFGVAVDLLEPDMLKHGGHGIDSFSLITEVLLDDVPGLKQVLIKLDSIQDVLNSHEVLLELCGEGAQGLSCSHSSLDLVHG